MFVDVCSQLSSGAAAGAAVVAATVGCTLTSWMTDDARVAGLAGATEAMADVDCLAVSRA